MERTDRALATPLATGTLRLGELAFDCAVVQLPDGTPERVLSRRKFHAAIGRHPHQQRQRDVQLPTFLASENLKPFTPNDIGVTCNVISYRSRGGIAAGYPARLLPLVCRVYLAARRAGVLRASQKHIAERCELLLDGLAMVGITALVDEACGYQQQREDDALQRFLDRYLTGQPLPWRETFAQDFYVQLHRLAGKPYDPVTRHRGLWVGQFTKRFIYDYLLPQEGYAALCQRNPRTSNDHYGRAFNHHQFLSAEMGKPHLLAHLNLVLGLMRSSPNLAAFRRLFVRAMPARLGNQMEIPLGE